MARGPEVIGMEDMGPQASGPRGFDVEAALGRQGEGENMAELARRGRDAAEDGDEDVVVTDVTTDANADADTDRERESGKTLDGVESR